MHRIAVVFALAAVVSACAAPAAEQKPETTTDVRPAAAALPTEVAAFHEVLKPLWHATPGAERTANVCAASAQLHQMATALKTTTPANVKPDFPAQAETLDAATARLETVCGTADKADFEVAFHTVHEAFHGLAEKCEG